MKVTLIDWSERALNVLLFTKLTRLSMTPKGMDEVAALSQAEKDAHLRHMRNTIKSSWEFTDYIFIIEGVTRAFTHQLVRHRVGTSFAQQSQRAVDMSDFDAIPGPSVEEDAMLLGRWDAGIEGIKETYRALIGNGADAQDARGILPTNVVTNISFKANLRTLHGMMSERLCVRAQGEFQDVCLAMREEVLRVHPWTEDFLKVHCVTTGTCLFPDLPVDQCAVKPWALDRETGEAYRGGPVGGRATMEAIWLNNRRSVQPPVAR